MFKTESSISGHPDIDYEIILHLPLSDILNVIKVNKAVYNNLKQRPIPRLLLEYISRRKKLSLLDWACSKGYISLLDWQQLDSLQLTCKYDWPPTDAIDITKGLELACKHGHLHILNRFKFQIEAMITDHDVNVSMRVVRFIRAAISKNHIVVLEWFRDNFNKLPEQMFQYAGLYAAEFGNIVILEWLISNIDASLSKIGHLIYEACKNGNVDVLQWIYEHCEFDTSQTYKYIEVACANGHVSILEWLIQHPEIPFEYYNVYIRPAIEHRYLGVLEWLERNKANINVNRVARAQIRVYEGNTPENIRAWMRNNPEYGPFIIDKEMDPFETLVYEQKRKDSSIFWSIYYSCKHFFRNLYN